MLGVFALRVRVFGWLFVFVGVRMVYCWFVVFGLFGVGWFFVVCVLLGVDII